MVHCSLCKQTRQHAYICIKQTAVCCTDCAIEIITVAKNLGLDITAEKLKDQQTVAIISGNSAS